ncbi:MAG TPA: hypothetical protein PKO06_18210, partial [Candidatus Ozemobacteraceae bacterium]|nr:hypothetical protein [Candidatus Ozemobacteraceae bacterium]
ECFAATLGLDVQRILAWSFAQAVLAAIWEIEDHGSLRHGIHWIMLANTVLPMLDRQISTDSSVASTAGFRVWNIAIGGKSKEDLLSLLHKSDIQLNEYARVLFSSDLFLTSTKRETRRIVELRVSDLQISGPATLRAIIQRARERDLEPCPLEVGPCFRLQFTNQEEEREASSHKAPQGSITIISDLFELEDENFPRGFYLRKIQNKFWLRGYVCSEDYVWNNEDRIAFQICHRRKEPIG